MNEDTKANLFNVDTWIRLLYMILFALLSVVARVVIYTIALVQFVLVLITARPNVQLLELGQGVAKWALQAFLFQTPRAVWLHVHVQRVSWLLLGDPP